MVSLFLQSCTINNIPVKPEAHSSNIDVDDNQQPIKESSVKILNSVIIYNDVGISKKPKDDVHPIVQSTDHSDLMQQTNIISIGGTFTDKKGSLFKKQQWEKHKKLQRTRQNEMDKSKVKLKATESVQEEQVFKDSGEYILRIQDPELIEKILLLEKIQNTINHIFAKPMYSLACYKHFRKNNLHMLFEGLIAQFLVKQILNDDELMESNGKVRLYIIQTLNDLSDHVQAILEASFFKRVYLKDKLDLINLFYCLKLRIAVAHLVYIGKKSSSGIINKSFLKEHVKRYEIARNSLKIKWMLPTGLVDDYLENLMEMHNIMVNRFPVLSNYFNLPTSLTKE
ncbi:hypothetical protein Aasi_1785 [Candidatus Amoebophilus asiaticus 5a2]|uniref:Uncharacterized protein n=1 Tax=Amoebophilus asiaticus (strain 5a2) TaxID=452471 RepID=C3L410_AMOA5|nr:hypothetical protein Aasi_1785 [Candidatus Amoebophilus asiaticus 5a2]